MATAAVELPHASTSYAMPADAGATDAQRRTSRFSSLRWSRKMFGNGSKKSAEDSEVAHDIKEAVKGGPATSAAQSSNTEETDAIQHVGGTGLSVNDPAEAINPAEPGHPKEANEASMSASSSRNRLELPPNAHHVDDEDPTAGAGALSAATGRSASIEPSDEDEDQSRAPSVLGQNGKSRAENGEADRIEFYRKDQPYYWLSNSSEHTVYFDGQRYATAEHLFQALKFLPSRPEIARKIRKANLADDAMREARKNMIHVKRGWIQQGKNVEAMRLVLLLKFSQHSRLSRQLLMTGDAELVEASPTDAFWGAANGSGISGLGRNELGKALQRTRENIRNQAGLGYGSAAQTV